MTNNEYCNRCGLEYRKSQIKMRMGICEDCEPEKFKKQYEKDIITMQKRRMGPGTYNRTHILPKRAPSTRYQVKKWYRRETK